MGIKVRSRAALVASLPSLFLMIQATGAYADSGVSWYTLDQPVRVVEPTAERLPMQLGHFFGIGQSAAPSAADLTERTLDFLRFHSDGSREPELHLEAIQSDARGSVLRFSQQYDGITVVDGDLIAFFNLEGKLTSVVSSLQAVPSIHPRAEISAEEALRAIAPLGTAVTAAKPVIFRASQADAPILAYQIEVAGHSLTEGWKVRVAAEGSQRGQIVDLLSLTATADAKPDLGKIIVHDATWVPVAPIGLIFTKGGKVLVDGKKTFRGNFSNLTDARAVDQNLSLARNFYFEHFGRKSYDNKSANTVVSVRASRTAVFDPFGMRQNAAWSRPFKAFIFGNGGKLLDNFPQALDVVAHEYTHAVIDYSSGLQYKGQSGALNEHLADFFGAAIENNHKAQESPFLIGDTVLRGKLKKKAAALRDMMNPHQGVSPQPGTVGEIPSDMGPDCVAGMGNDNCGVHHLSGIPNRVTAKMARDLGWDTILPMMYRVMTVRLLPSANFVSYREQVLAECAETLPAASCAAVTRAFNEAGIQR